MKLKAIITSQALHAMLAGDQLCPRCNGLGRSNQTHCVTCNGIGTTVPYYARTNHKGGKQ